MDRPAAWGQGRRSGAAGSGAGPAAQPWAGG